MTMNEADLLVLDIWPPEDGETDTEKEVPSHSHSLATHNVNKALIFQARRCSSGGNRAASHAALGVHQQPLRPAARGQCDCALFASHLGHRS